jgi:hypothetical protein
VDRIIETLANQAPALGVLVSLCIMFLKSLDKRDKAIGDAVTEFKGMHAQMLETLTNVAEVLGENKTVMHQAKNALHEQALRKQLQESQ